jgi:hypothetical protein
MFAPFKRPESMMVTDNGSAGTLYQPPWRDAPDGVAANLALADLVNNLPRRLTVDGRTHADTLLATRGAIAGYAAQRAVLSVTAPEAVTPANGFQMVQANNGDLFLFGEPVDRALLPQWNGDADKLWPLAAGAAISAGLDPNSLPALPPMFEHVGKTIGGPREGLPSFEDTEFLLPAKDLLKTVWPFALQCFNGQISGKALNPPVAVSQRWRPVVAALAASRLIGETAHVIAPLKALTIVMETAIYASKLMPSAVETPAPQFSA